MTAPAYVQRRIDLTFQLGKGAFGDSGYNTITHRGLRVTIQTDWANLDAQPHALIRVWGLTLSEMNQLTKAGLNYLVRNDKVQVDAGDDQNGMSTVFTGSILEAYPDFGQTAEAAFTVVALGGADVQLRPVTPVTFSGSVSFETAMQQILKPSGFSLENNGVEAVFQSPYYPGGIFNQINRALRSANAFGVLDPMANKIAAWPKQGARSGDPVLVAPQTRMIGYPAFEQQFIRVKQEFAGDRYRGPGKKIRVESQLLAARGTWNLIQVNLNLASELPNGPWEISMKAFHEGATGG